MAFWFKVAKYSTTGMLLIFVLAFALLLPQLEATLESSPNIYSEVDVTAMLQVAYDRGRLDGGKEGRKEGRLDSHCLLPKGKHVSRKGGIDL